jgi:hypothetical protein
MNEVNEWQLSGRVPGSGQLDEHARVLVARMQAVIEITHDTVMVKVLPPASVGRYLAGEVSAGEWGKRPPFDYRLVGGTVARRQDTTNLRTPAELFQAFRLDYPASPFRRDLPAIPVMEFLAGDPDQYVTPLGAPTVREPQLVLEEASPEVRAAAYAMVAAAESAGLDPNTYRKEIAPWPYTGTGITAADDLAVPERWRPHGLVPRGAVIMERTATSEARMIAIYRNNLRGWKDVR